MEEAGARAGAAAGKRSGMGEKARTQVVKGAGERVWKWEYEINKNKPEHQPIDAQGFSWCFEFCFLLLFFKFAILMILMIFEIFEI